MDGDSTCRLLGGVFSYALQIALAVLAFSSLVIKRARERPPIELRVWVLNVSKQVVSLAAAHVFAIIASIVLSTTFHGASECAWYAVIFSVDTIVGTALTVILHKAALGAVETYLYKASPSHLRMVCETVVSCGSYGNPPSLVSWGWQALEWTVCVLLARFACAMLVAVLGPGLLAATAVSIDSLFYRHRGIQLAFVMIVWPLMVNSAQALLQDAVLRAKRLRGGDGMAVEMHNVL